VTTPTLGVKFGSMRLMTVVVASTLHRFANSGGIEIAVTLPDESS
jgi:hypothetical protein